MEAWWIVFWVFFGLFALLGMRGMFRIPFCVFLCLMRAWENQMPQNCWVAFWLCFVMIYPDLYYPVDAKAIGSWWVIFLVVRIFFVTSEYYMPTAVFWVLFVLLWPTLATLGAGSLLCWVVFIFNWHLKADGIQLPGLLIPAWAILAFAATLLVVANLLRMPGYLPAVFIWFAFVGVMHHNFWPWNPDFGLLWFGAWFLSLQSTYHAFAPSMSVAWYVLMTAIFVGFGFLIRPDESLLRLFLWSMAVGAVRFLLFGIYVFYFISPFNPNLFPFNYFSDTWKISQAPWQPLNLRAPDSISAAKLCQRCHVFTSESKLIMGSSSYLTRLVEEHDFWTRREFVTMCMGEEEAEAFAGASTSSPSSCHLCRLLWYSMSRQRRQTIAQSVDLIPTVITGDQLPQPEDPDAELRVKVWEERPLSRYTFMQLLWGDTAVGARLLVHRDGDIPIPSKAVEYPATNSALHFEQAKQWLNLCKENHKHCQGAGNTKPNPPARLIHVVVGEDWQPGDPPLVLKLIEASHMDAEKGYLALSHCWGPTAEMRFKLLASNIDRCFETIDFDSLSQNLKDAVTVTASLGFSYIWIDSLCIMQKDDTGTETGEVAERWRSDWKTEAKKMGSVYSGAACTIASTGSATSKEGCFHKRNVQSLSPCRIGVSSVESLTPSWIYARRDDVFDFEKSVDLAPLNTRGWVMQERLLSRRILHFGASMIYWECCGRSASELNPLGYTYKTFPEDFEDNYFPDLRSRIATRGDLQKAEREGNGISWATVEEVRRRPPPVMLDPDAPPSTQAVWQRKRGFWKNILKPSTEPWSADEEVLAAARAGFRATFEQLRSVMGHAAHSPTTANRVGRDSFSQAWYDIVETYSRGNLTAPTDKLIALKGIEDEVARATKFTYLKGLWQEHLLTDLLWFAIEGPGKRLLAADGVPVAPTWSWASIQGTVALDLLPDTAALKIEETKMLVTVEHVEPSSDDPQQMSIILSGPLLPIEAPTLEGTTTWSLDLGHSGTPSARVFPDVASPDIGSMGDLFCLSFVLLDREKKGRLVRSSSEDVQGLVLRLFERGHGPGALDMFERVGYFTTSYIVKSGAAKKGRKALENAPVMKLCLSGWSGSGCDERGDPAGGTG